MGEYDQYGYDAYGGYDYAGADAGLYEDYTPTPDYSTSDYTGGDPYAGYGSDMSGAGSMDGSVGVDDNAAFASMGYEDLGGGQWFDASDGSTYDEATQSWSQPAADDTGETGYTDPYGNTFYADGTIAFPDGSTLDPSGDLHVADGAGVLGADGSWTDESGQAWENMAYAGAPALWQNTATGDVWDNNSGQVTYATVPPINPSLLEQGTDGRFYSKDTSPTPTSKPSGGGSGGGSPAGSGSSSSKPSSSPLSDMTKILDELAKTKLALDAAKRGVTTAQTPAQLAAAKAQLAQSSLAYQQALADKSGASVGGIPKYAVWIAAGAGALLLLTALMRPRYAAPTVRAA